MSVRSHTCMHACMTKTRLQAFANTAYTNKALTMQKTYQYTARSHRVQKRSSAKQITSLSLVDEKHLQTEKLIYKADEKRWSGWFQQPEAWSPLNIQIQSQGVGDAGSSAKTSNELTLSIKLINDETGHENCKWGVLKKILNVIQWHCQIWGVHSKLLQIHFRQSSACLLNLINISKTKMAIFKNRLQKRKCFQDDS